METYIDGSQLFDELRKALGWPAAYKEKAVTRLRSRTMEAIRNIKMRMPVDTGAARASWGSEGESGILRFEDEGLTSIQGSELGYIEYLNQGSSTQAPAGFLDAEQEKAVNSLIDDLLKDIAELLS